MGWGYGANPSLDAVIEIMGARHTDTADRVQSGERPYVTTLGDGRGNRFKPQACGFRAADRECGFPGGAVPRPAID